MQITSECKNCLYSRQLEIANTLTDKKTKKKFLNEINETMIQNFSTHSAPHMFYLFHEIHKQYFDDQDFYRKEKIEFNNLVLSIEQQIEECILQSTTPLEKAIVYATLGNYIDFGAVKNVNPNTLLTLLNEKSNIRLPSDTYLDFNRRCENGKTFLLLCDNCGEIVLDKLFIRQLKRNYPHLTVYSMVRGEPILNDVTIDDAIQCGLDKESIVIPNGNGVPGTVIELLSPEAKNILESADIILAKGQGNYECLSGCPITIFYAFLCKCDVFTDKFNVPKFTNMFIKEPI